MSVAIGWLGAILFIVAYFLLSIKLMKADGIPYQLMNVLGAICLIINSISLNDDPNLITNLVWMFIGIYAMFNIILKKQS